jgi:hypothetical protein
MLFSCETDMYFYAGLCVIVKRFYTFCKIFGCYLQFYKIIANFYSIDIQLNRFEK